jgi:hypothetical protein
MTALAASALFLFLQSVTTAATTTQNDHRAVPAQAKTKAKASSASTESIAKPEEDNIRVVEVCLPTLISAPPGPNISLLAKEFISLADAMPEDKYRGTFAQQLTHVADANFLYAYPLVSNEHAPNDIEKPTNKADILAYLRASFDALEKADAIFIDRVRECRKSAEEILPLSVKRKVFDDDFEILFMPSGNFGWGTVGLAAVHCRAHYRQIIEHERMNGIVPPPTPLE